MPALLCQVFLSVKKPILFQINGGDLHERVVLQMGGGAGSLLGISQASINSLFQEQDVGCPGPLALPVAGSGVMSCDVSGLRVLLLRVSITNLAWFGQRL